MFNEFPYVNMHELNLDWIIKKVKEAYSPDNPPEGVVLSVNGQDGNVILYQDAIVRFPDVQDGTWNVHRIAGGASSGIQFTPTKAQRISGANRYDMYDSNNPPPYPVTSVNGQTGDVSIQIPVQSVNGQTGVVVIPPDFQNGDEIMEFTQESEGNYWGLSRTVSTGNASIYLDTSNNTVKAYISFNSTDGQTNVTYPLLTSADIPSSSGVVSINSKTGVVTLYGTDIYEDSNSPTTISQALASNALNITSEMNRAKSVEQNIMAAVAVIVSGNASSTGASVGQYVYVKDSTITGVTDGLYKATQTIPANTVIDSTYLTAVSGGGLNSLNDSLTPKDVAFSTSASGAVSTVGGKLHQIGKICILDLAITLTGSVTSDWLTIATLPLHPSYGIAMDFTQDVSGGAGNTLRVSLTTSGVVRVFYGGTGNYNIQLVYCAD